MILRRSQPVFVLGWLLTAGCASYQIPPLPTSHPANPDAPAGQAPSPSRTLAYSPSDIPHLQPVPPVASAPHQGLTSRATEAEKSQAVVGEGAVVATIPTASQVVLDHEEIKGFMEPMTMGYRVDPPKLLEGLKPGDRVRFTIDVQRRTITAIEPLR